MKDQTQLLVERIDEILSDQKRRDDLRETCRNAIAAGWRLRNQFGMVPDDRVRILMWVWFLYLIELEETAAANTKRYDRLYRRMRYYEERSKTWRHHV